MTEHSRLRWLCRRGMKELDVLLERYLAERYPQAPADEQRAFRELLECQDPVLWDYVMDHDQPQDEALRNVVHELTAAHRA